MKNAERRCCAHPLGSEPELIAEARNLNLINYCVLSKLNDIPHLKVIQGEFLKQNTDVKNLSQHSVIQQKGIEFLVHTVVVAPKIINKHG